MFCHFLKLCMKWLIKKIKKSCQQRSRLKHFFLHFMSDAHRKSCKKQRIVLSVQLNRKKSSKSGQSLTCHIGNINFRLIFHLIKISPLSINFITRIQRTIFCGENFVYFQCLQSDSHLPKKLFLFFWMKPFFKKMKNAIYFILKVLSFLSYLHFCPNLLVMQKNVLIRKLRLILNFMTLQRQQQIITMHILPNISEVKEMRQ